METTVQTIENHIVILGWSKRVRRILRELQHDTHRSSNDLRPVVVVAPETTAKTPEQLPRVYFVYGSITDPLVLRRANVVSAHAVLLPVPDGAGPGADGNSVFALLAALAANPDVRICVEVANADNGAALAEIRDRGLLSANVEIVSFEAMAEHFLAQAAINPGVTALLESLLSFGRGEQQLYACRYPAGAKELPFGELAKRCAEHDVILLGYDHQRQLHLNPGRAKTVVPGDKLWFIAASKAAGVRAVESL